jgi:hypothetical protein
MAWVARSPWASVLASGGPQCEGCSRDYPSRLRSGLGRSLVGQIVENVL